jgi:methionyl aminopeptidase
MNERLEIARECGKIHNKIRREIKEWIQPGLSMIDICNKIENRIQELTLFDINNPIKAGIGFPTGVSLNECAAHWTPDPGDKRILKYNDVCKIDYGVQKDGIIIDSAFTIHFDPKFDNLIEASKTSTEIALKMAGPDVCLGEIGAVVQENMESFEIELDNKIIPIKSIKTLTGHQIEPYKIHAGKSVPNYKINYPERMLEGEYYAVETFASTGTGITSEGIPCSHFMIDYNKNYEEISLSTKEKKIFNHIKEKFHTLAFCNRWLDFYNIKKYPQFLKSLASVGVIKKYPPLNDIKGSFTSQHEHSIVIKEKGIEILSDL